MAIRLLVVDDSGFFQKRISEILKSETDIQIVGFANNGREAIEKALTLNPDVITMDYEMPVMDGLTALRNIMQVKPTPILMFSSLTYDGARVTLDALEAGAIDFLPKNFEDLQRGGNKIRSLLSEKIKAVARSYNRTAAPSKLAVKNTVASVSPTSKQGSIEPNKVAVKKPFLTNTVVASSSANTENQQIKNTKPNTKLTGIDLVLIGTSTGGPVALQHVLTALPANFSKPILLIQHMPASFTGAFAERLNGLCRITVQLAKDGDSLKPGVALLAPGGQQMMVERGKVRVIDGDDRMNYRPSVDLTFASAAKHFPNKSLAIILTGMGSDGCEGAKLMKQTGCPIWSQDKDSSVIYGMPMAVAKANISDAILPLKDVGPLLAKEVQ
ncbi:MAG: two-component system chemotaxis response regulator CheB [Bermanella sp.]|jgi:two-component system chemotaxis response regulator CheB